MDAVLLFSSRARTLQAGGSLRPEKRLYHLRLAGKASTFKVSIAAPGSYALFTQHDPEEFQATLRHHQGPFAPTLTHAYKPDHQHDETVTSVGISMPGDVDVKNSKTTLRWSKASN